MRIKSKRLKVNYKLKNRVLLHQRYRTDKDGNWISRAGQYMASEINTEAATLKEHDGVISHDAHDPSSLEADCEEQGRPQVPGLFATLPPIRDHLTTASSISQDSVIEQCLSCLTQSSRQEFDVNAHGITILERESHTGFLHGVLETPNYIAYDPVRPWLIYWSLTALGLLGENLGPYRQRCVLLRST